MNSTQSVTQNNQGSNLLKNALRGNALFSGTSGLIALLAAQSLTAFTGIEPPIIFVLLGIVLILYAVDLWWITSRETINRRFAWAAIILDVLWVVGSIAILLFGWLPLTVAGSWTIVLLAEVVAIFAVLQYFGLRRLS
jgi:hypothetical protein